MQYTENKETFWKYHSMGCGYCGEFKRTEGLPDDQNAYFCPKCGSEFIPEQEYNGEYVTFVGRSVNMFDRVTNEDLIEELQSRGYKIEGKERTLEDLFKERVLKKHEGAEEIYTEMIKMEMRKMETSEILEVLLQNLSDDDDIIVDDNPDIDRWLENSLIVGANAIGRADDACLEGKAFEKAILNDPDCLNCTWKLITLMMDRKLRLVASGEIKK